MVVRTFRRFRLDIYSQSLRFIYRLYEESRLPWALGGEYELFHGLILRVVRGWIAVGLRPYFVFDGEHRSSQVSK
jgi:hypothetical protein